MHNDIEPLAPELWIERLSMIARGELPGIENALRHAGHLAQLAPLPFRARTRLTVSETEYEALLDRRSFDAAARLLVDRCEILPAQEEQAGGPGQTRVRCVVLDCAVVGHGESLAHAILDAWASALLAIDAQALSAGTSIREEAAMTGSSLADLPRARTQGAWS